MNIPLLSSVLTAGLIDSFNPCAITVLLLFIGLMFSLQKSRRYILLIGFVYILSIYITYLLIGLGLLQIMNFFGVPHLMSIIGALIAIVFGLWNIKDYFWPNWGPSLRISLNARQKIMTWSYKGTLLAAVVVGILVGITEFPCSGAIYLAIISLLNSQTTFWQGFDYLLIYNIMFVLPLILIFIFANNRLVAEKMTYWQEAKGGMMKLVLGIAMLVLGGYILMITIK